MLMKTIGLDDKCYKPVTKAAIHKFVHEHLTEDNIEFIHDFGLLCLHFDVEDILKKLETLKESRPKIERNYVYVPRYPKPYFKNSFVKDKTQHDISLQRPESAIEQAISIKRPGRPGFKDDEDDEEFVSDDVENVVRDVVEGDA